MKVHRFSLDHVPLGDELIITDPQLIHQFLDVLELRVGEQVQIFDQVNERQASIGFLNRDQLILSLGVTLDPLPPLVHQLQVAVSLLKGDAWDDMVREVSQLGVTSIQPLVCQRSIVRELNNHKRKRYELIAKEATELSGGREVPALLPPINFLEWVAQTDPTRTFLLDQAGQPLSTLSLPQQLTFGIGPEGGWTPEELQTASHQGLTQASLLPRVLTARFAPAAAAAALLFVDSSQAIKKLL